MLQALIALVALLAVLVTDLGAATTPLAITRKDQRDVMVTIYNGDLGLVKDVREARLPAGTEDVEFRDVAAQIDPTSVHLRSLSGDGSLKILEQNYEYDLMSSQKLMEKYVGRTVRLYGSDGTYHQARLLSVNGPVYEINGEIHLGQPGQVVLPSLPENLVTKPTLVWLLRSATGNAQRVEASYLTGGLTWRADYVVVLDAADARADLTGWVTIDNRSGAAYPHAALKLVAGDVNRAGEPRRVGRVMELAAKAPGAADATRDFAAEGFFEYHLYTLDGRTTIKDNQTKQLALLSATAVPVRTELVYSGVEDYYRTHYPVPFRKQKVQAFLEIRNASANRLGIPLPRGKVRVYKADRSGSEQLVGEDWIDHTPKDEVVKIKLGNAFDVVAERTQKDWRKLGPNVWEIEWEISLRNHKNTDQTVTVIEPVPGDWEVLRSTHKWEKIEAHTLRFHVPVKKDGTETIAYRVRIRY